MPTKTKLTNSYSYSSSFSFSDLKLPNLSRIIRELQIPLVAWFLVQYLSHPGLQILECNAPSPTDPKSEFKARALLQRMLFSFHLETTLSCDSKWNCITRIHVYFASWGCLCPSWIFCILATRKIQCSPCYKVLYTVVYLCAHKKCCCYWWFGRHLGCHHWKTRVSFASKRAFPRYYCNR